MPINRPTVGAMYHKHNPTPSYEASYMWEAEYFEQNTHSWDEYMPVGMHICTVVCMPTASTTLWPIEHTHPYHTVGVTQDTTWQLWSGYLSLDQDSIETTRTAHP